LEAAKTALVNQQLADLQRKQQKEADEQAAFERSLQGLQGAFDPKNRKEMPRLDPNSVGPQPQETLLQALASPHGQAALTTAATDFIRGGQKADEFGDLARVLASVSSIGQGGKLDSLIQSTRSAAGDTPLGVNQALSIEGQQDIFDRNQEAKPVDIKKVATNEFLSNVLQGKESSPELTAAFNLTRPKGREITLPDGTRISDGNSGTVNQFGKLTNTTRTDLQRRQRTNAGLKVVTGELSKLISTDTVGLLAAFRRSGLMKTVSSISDLAGMDIGSFVGASQEQVAAASEFKFKAAQLIGRMIPLVTGDTSGRYTDFERKLTEDAARLGQDNTSVVEAARIIKSIEDFVDLDQKLDEALYGVQEREDRDPTFNTNVNNQTSEGGRNNETLKEKLKARGLRLE